MMTKNKYKELLAISSGSHLNLVPSVKLPEMDKDVIVNKIIIDPLWGNCILYGVSETCDGYTIPFSWINDYKIVS